jgi:hypothetical protein
MSFARRRLRLRHRRSWRAEKVKKRMAADVIASESGMSPSIVL